MYVKLSEHTSTIPHWFHVLFSVLSVVHFLIMATLVWWSLGCIVPWYMFLFQLQIISSIVKQPMTTGTTRLLNWLDPSTVCYRRSSKDLHCLLWSSGMTMCCQTTPNFLQLLVGSFWPAHRCWQLSKRLGAYIWTENSNVTPVDFWKSSLARWSFGSWMGPGQWDRGLPVWIPVLRSGGTTARAVIDEEPPWHRWCPVVLLLAGWFPCSSATV